MCARALCLLFLCPGSYTVQGWTAQRIVQVSEKDGFSCSCPGFRVDCDLCHHIFSAIKFIRPIVVQHLGPETAIAFILTCIKASHWWLTRYACISSVDFGDLLTRSADFKRGAAGRATARAEVVAKAAAHAAEKAARDNAPYRRDGVARRSRARRSHDADADLLLALAAGGAPAPPGHDGSV